MITGKFRRKGQAGFTLLEIIVVIAIMGFLVAMVAPRFAGIVSGTVDVVCDSNQLRLYTAVAAFVDERHTLPSELVSIATGPLGGLVAREDDRPAGDTSHVLSDDSVDRNNLHNHVLSGAEAAELRAMGITYVRVVGGAQARVATGLVVAMVGFGGENATVTNLRITVGEFGEYEHVGRILFGVAADSELADVGFITEAGLCPGGIRKEGVFNHYLMVVPRLDATVARIYGDDRTLAYVAGMDEDGNTTGQVANNHELEGQLGLENLWRVDTQCPEGHKWPGDENEVWVVTP